ncbi:BolA family protein [Rhodoferax antarcticus]|uniref:BolA-like family protein n=1 Tax=Rhodoferax antarcticus ANT.BR TaxID=1111071 RepID=A0A1Q8YEM7_9BURK|nr:BolA family protein [Rhodoferax antarcticus]APW46291.1 BolA family transcriptional regulator [Rhodoferax antarcticus]MCW2313108.1 BolA protein [Rhodoferax antarcticus]OLP06501.1 BolA-like family protein [Rhodoferax antarcticus ANT.BR]
MTTILAPTAARLQQRLQSVLQPSALEVIDESAQHAGHIGANDSGAGTHFRVRITCQQFVGERPVTRHRLVYDALQDFLDQGLHALAIEAKVPTC